MGLGSSLTDTGTWPGCHHLPNIDQFICFISVMMITLLLLRVDSHGQPGFQALPVYLWFSSGLLIDVGHVDARQDSISFLSTNMDVQAPPPSPPGSQLSFWVTPLWRFLWHLFHVVLFLAVLPHLGFF